MILLDTHTLVWMATDPGKLSKTATQIIRRTSKSDGIAIASITLWEIAFLLARGRLKAHGTIRQTVENYVDRSNAHVLEVTAEIAAVASQLPSDIPGDPYDRLIVATALVHAIPLVTKDTRIHASKACKAVW